MAKAKHEQAPGAAQASPERLPEDEEQIVERVRERYAELAELGGSACCPGESGSAETDTARRIGYDERDLEALPEGANLGLGCGAPVRHLGLKPGETVLDLGSGGGLDAFLAAREVGPRGTVIGVDMTPEMIRRAADNARRAGLPQVEFRLGRLEALPVEDASIDAVTSNCVINLVPDKRRVFLEIGRVLRPGGRLVISDIVLDGELPEPVRRDLLAYVGCVAGAMRREGYFAAVRQAGLSAIELLEDVDLLAAMGDRLPDEARELIERTGVQPEELRGLVHSVTFRAVKS